LTHNVLVYDNDLIMFCGRVTSAHRQEINTMWCFCLRY